MRDDSDRGSPPPIRARLLGRTDLRVGDRNLPPEAWRRRPARHILLMLLGAPGHRLSRDAVLDALWPDHSLDYRLNSLYKAIHSLRRTLEPGLQAGRASAYIDIRDEWIAIVPHDGLWVDVDRFEGLLRQAATDPEPRDALHAALDLYRGAFMADEPYADWPMARREALRRARERAVLNLARLDLARGYPLASLGHLESLLIEDPASEEVHRAIVRAMLARGQRAAALQQIERCRLALRRELGVEIDAETEALAAMARAAPASPPDVVPGVTGVPMLNLPGLPTATVGRTRDIVAAREMLAERATRLVIIVGPGGVGKTRLATEIGRAAGSHFPDGIAYVPLEAIRDASMLYPAIAGVLQVNEAPGGSLVEAVHDVLRRRPCSLLVLDNLEHLAGVALPVAELLAAVPSLTMLATSREPLRIRAERVYRLEPLAVAAEGSGMEPERLREVDSVALFLRCARAWGIEERKLDDATLPAVAAVCRRLDGLPLAIELAATRAVDSSPSAILAQLDDRFATLRDGPHDLPDRHQTLRATIGWSYDLLSEAEQRLFRGLAAFAGGIEIDALRAMFGPAALRLAETLVDKSLLRQDQRFGQQRLTMLESIREFAAEMLGDHGELAARQVEHARFFAGLVEREGVSGTAGARQVERARRMEREQDNIHLALDTSLESGDGATALRIAAAMGFHWFTHGPTRQARAWVERALALAPGPPSEALAWTCLWGAAIAWRMADAVAGERFEGQARATWLALESPAGLARVDHAIAIRLGLQGRYDESLDLHRDNLETFRAFSDGEGIVFSLAGMAHALAMAGRPVEAVALLEEALATSREHDDLALQSYVLARLPSALLGAGRAREAGQAAIEGERVARLVGDQRSLPWAFMVQASLAFDRDDHAHALDRARAAHAGFRDVGDSLNEWLGAMACMVICTTMGQLDEARAYAVQTARGVGARDASEMAAALPELADCLLALGYPAEALVAYAAGLGSERAPLAVFATGAEARHAVGIRRVRSRLSSGEADVAWERGEHMTPAGAVEHVRRCLLASAI